MVKFCRVDSNKRVVVVAKFIDATNELCDDEDFPRALKILPRSENEVLPI